MEQKQFAESYWQKRIICFHKRRFSQKEFNTRPINFRDVDNFQVTFKNRN